MTHLGQCGNCNYMKIVWLVWLFIYISIILYFVIISPILYHEILLNLQISSVFWQISLCILWNLWILALNLQYFKLKSIIIVTFFRLLTISSPPVTQRHNIRFRGESELFQWSVFVFTQFRFVSNYSQYLQYFTLKSLIFYYEILINLWISIILLCKFHSCDIVKSMDFN